MLAKRIQVDVWSDVSCPWCWVGKKRFDKALEQLQDAADFHVVYHSYIIDHKTAPQGERYLDYNVRRWGSDSWCDGLRRSGRPNGATFEDWQWWPASMKAHQLLLLAQERGLGREAKELLLHKTYEEGANISQVDTLVELAQELGLPVEEVRRHLEEDRGRAAVLAEDAHGKKELGISGVPFFIISSAEDSSAEGHALSGAQPVGAFVKTVKQVLSEQQQRQQQ